MARDDLDLVIIATPWDWHVDMAVAAMKHGKHAAIEVPAATTIEDCWRLVDTSEETRRHCMMLENCCYGANETTVLRMAHAGLFGDLLYGEGAYLHDLRDELFSNKGEGLWRRDFHTRFNGNLYPTHGLGPVANYMGINRGDRFDYIVSMSTPQRGLDEYRKAHCADTDPRWAERYITGDLNTSLIKTAKGLNITLKHDTSNPHPYDRLNVIGGTKGVFADYPPRIYFDGQAGEEAVGLARPVQAVPAPAVGEGRRDRQEAGRPRRHGLHHALSPAGVHARRPVPRHGCLRRGGVVGSRAAERGVGGQRQRAAEVPRFHPREMEGAAGIADRAVEGSRTGWTGTVVSMKSVSDRGAIGFALAGFTFWVLADSSIKLVGQSGLPPYEMVAFLGLFMAIFLGAYGVWRRDTQALRPRKLKRQVARACLDMANNVCVVIALRHLTLTLVLHPDLYVSHGDRPAVGDISARRTSVAQGTRHYFRICRCGDRGQPMGQLAAGRLDRLCRLHDLRCLLLGEHGVVKGAHAN